MHRMYSLRNWMAMLVLFALVGTPGSLYTQNGENDNHTPTRAYISRIGTNTCSLACS